MQTFPRNWFGSRTIHVGFAGIGLALLRLACALITLAPQAHAQGGVPLWTNWGGAALAVDSSGNVVVTDRSANTNMPPYHYYYETIKFSGAGVPLWTNRYHGPAGWNDEPFGVAVDAIGNVFVTGGCSATPYEKDYATVAYSSTGLPLWTNRYNEAGFHDQVDDVAVAVAMDGSGNVFVTGYSFANESGYDYATLKYSGAGMPLWTNRYTGSVAPGDDPDYATALVVDGSGNVIVTGYSSDTGNYDFEYATIKYSNAGAPLWTNHYNFFGAGNTGNDRPVGVVVDTGGNVFVAGNSWNGSNSDWATVAYASAGAPLWTNRWNGPGNGNDFASAVAVDRSGNVVVTGQSESSGRLTGNYATIKYSGAGVPRWTNYYNGPRNGDDYASAIAVDSSGNVFVTGDSSGSGTSSHDEVATVAYSSAGVPLWTNRYNGYASAIAVDRSGNVFVTGSETIKYSSSVPLVHLDFQRLNNQLVLSWTNAGFNLQSAPALIGSFTNVAGATSPYTNLIVDPQQFFRLKAN